MVTCLVTLRRSLRSLKKEPCSDDDVSCDLETKLAELEKEQRFKRGKRANDLLFSEVSAWTTSYCILVSINSLFKCCWGSGHAAIVSLTSDISRASPYPPASPQLLNYSSTTPSVAHLRLPPPPIIPNPMLNPDATPPLHLLHHAPHPRLLRPLPLKLVHDPHA